MNMPTGYTADVQSGKVTEFPEFAMQCARAFGALISMRDEPASAPIPDEFKPSDYNAEALKKAEAELARLLGMSLAEVNAAAQSAYEQAVEAWERRDRLRTEHRARYNAMLQKARAWTPPTIEHEELKKFMIEQLTESIHFDTVSKHDAKPEKQEPGDWYRWIVEQARRNVDYRAKAHREEVQRARERTEWVRALRDSLKQSVTA
jgi:hypothetical protein